MRAAPLFPLRTDLKDDRRPIDSRDTVATLYTMNNDNETCCAVCGDEIRGEGFDNGYTVTCADCSDPEGDEPDSEES